MKERCELALWRRRIPEPSLRGLVTLYTPWMTRKRDRRSLRIDVVAEEAEGEWSHRRRRIFEMEVQIMQPPVQVAEGHAR